MTDTDKKRYLLQEAHHERIFQRRIVPRALAGGQPQVAPVVYMLGGQPGAGKSRTKATLLAHLTDRGGGVELDGDLFRGYHPRYDELLAEDDRRAAYYTDFDAGRWLDKATSYVTERRVNVVLEGTMRRPAFVAQTCDRYRAAGYRVEAAILAVPEALSRLGVLQRYQQQKAARGHGRFSTSETHDAGYAGLLDTADAIDRDGLADAVTVYRRGGTAVYANRLNPTGRWREPPATRAAIEAERRRAWTPAESETFHGDLGKVADALGDAWTAECEQIRALARDRPPDGAVESHRRHQRTRTSLRPRQVDLRRGP